MATPGAPSHIEKCMFLVHSLVFVLVPYSANPSEYVRKTNCNHSLATLHFFKTLENCIYGSPTLHNIITIRNTLVYCICTLIIILRQSFQPHDPSGNNYPLLRHSFALTQEHLRRCHNYKRGLCSRDICCVRVYVCVYNNSIHIKFPCGNYAVCAIISWISSSCIIRRSCY